MVQGKVNTKEFFAQRNIIPLEEAHRPFCEVNNESVPHLFLHCSYVWKCWCRFIKWLDFQWCIPSTNADLLLDQNYLFKGRFQCKALLSLAFGVLWGIWLVRNKRVFLGDSCEYCDTVFELVLHCLTVLQLKMIFS